MVALIFRLIEKPACRKFLFFTSGFLTLTPLFQKINQICHYIKKNNKMLCNGEISWFFEFGVHKSKIPTWKTEISCTLVFRLIEKSMLPSCFTIKILLCISGSSIFYLNEPPNVWSLWTILMLRVSSKSSRISHPTSALP